MTKLQKRPPPAYPGLSTNTASAEGGIRYENLSQDTQQPIPLTASQNQAAVSGALGSNNPYNTARYQQPPTFPVFSPVSPMDAPTAPRALVSAHHIHAPQPHRASMDARKSVELRRLDGSPYNATEQKKVKVAKDMHEGALPPAYKRTASDPINPTDVAAALGNNQTRPHDCSRCGKGRTTVGQADQAHACTKCGKHKSTTSSAPHSRVVSQSAASVPRAAPPPTSPTVAGPSAIPAQIPGQHRHCHKCGKKKKPTTAPLQQQPFNGIPPAPNSAPLPEVRLSRPQRPGISIQQAPNIGQGVNPQIDIIPPSASTYRPNSLQSPFSQYGDETPLVARATKQEYSLFRNSSLVRSLSRRLSGKDKRTSEGPLPSQQLRASQTENGEQGTGRLINMISKAINESGNDKNQQQYSRLSAQEQPSRPSSPFSFMETANESESFELSDMKDSKDKEKATSPTSPQSEPSIYSPIIIEETLDVDVDRRSKQLEQQKQSNPGGLGVPGQEEGSKPPLTRFKSLRQGVNRAASVTRATSLRRLESLKTVHTAWYRDDLAIEGHNGESVPVF